MSKEDTDRLSNAIKDWVEGAESGRFSSRELDMELDIKNYEERNLRRQVLFQLKKAGLIEYVPDRVGLYRKINSLVSEINWRNANGERIFKMRFPFGLERWVIILPKNIIIIAGEKDAGKTALCLNIAMLNMDAYDVVYFSSEMAELELMHRIQRFEDTKLIPKADWKCDFIERDSNFADVIRPDSINIVDFLEIYKDFYEVGGFINQIYRRLKGGVAVIVLHKNPGVDLPIGRGRGLEKARLAVSMGGGKLKILVGKNWAKESVNPVGKEFKYKLIKGAKFVHLNKEFSEAENNFFEGE